MMMWVRARHFWFCCLLLGPLVAHAENNTTASGPATPVAGENDTAKGANKGKDKAAVTPEREAAAMAFVKQHHPELAELLTHLKTKNPKEYDRAVRELFRSSEQLAQVKERDPARYEIELKRWKVKSRLQLLVARSQMDGSAAHEAEIKAALGEQFDLEMALLDHERKLQAERLDKLDKRIARMKPTRENVLETQYQSLLSSGKTVEPGKPRHAEKAVLKGSEEAPEAKPASPAEPAAK